MIKAQSGFDHRSQGGGSTGMADIGLGGSNGAWIFLISHKVMQGQGFQAVFCGDTAAVSLHVVNRCGCYASLATTALERTNIGFFRRQICVNTAAAGTADPFNDCIYFVAIGNGAV